MLIHAPQNTVAHEAQEVEFPEVVLMSQGCVEGAAGTFAGPGYRLSMFALLPDEKQVGVLGEGGVLVQ